MILDKLESAKTYCGLHKGIDMALAAMKDCIKETYTTGKRELDGDDVFLLCNAYETHAPETGVMEAHRVYIDVMYMVEGAETIYVKPVPALKNVTKEYDPAIEALLADMEMDATAVRLEEGSFIVLFPQDAHAPACHAGTQQAVKKIIAKVRL